MAPGVSHLLLVLWLNTVAAQENPTREQRQFLFPFLNRFFMGTALGHGDGNDDTTR